MRSLLESGYYRTSVLVNGQWHSRSRCNNRRHGVPFEEAWGLDAAGTSDHADAFARRGGRPAEHEDVETRGQLCREISVGFRDEAHEANDSASTGFGEGSEMRRVRDVGEDDDVEIALGGWLVEPSSDRLDLRTNRLGRRQGVEDRDERESSAVDAGSPDDQRLDIIEGVAHVPGKHGDAIVDGRAEGRLGGLLAGVEDRANLEAEFGDHQLCGSQSSVPHAVSSSHRPAGGIRRTGFAQQVARLRCRAGGSMSTILRILLITTAIIIVGLIVLKPRRFRTLGQKLRLVGYLYVLAIIIGAVMQLAGWRT